MLSTYRHGRPTIGVLAGWQYYWTATPLSYLNPIYRGVRQAVADLGCNLLFGCGMGESATSSDPLRPAWFTSSSETDFAPIGPWNTDGIIAVNPLHGAARSGDCQALIAAGHPVVFIASGESGPTIVADNAAGIRQAMRHLVDHGHRRIAFIAGTPEDVAGDTGARLQAYRAALQELGLAADERIVAYGRHITAGGYVALRQIMETGAPFTAVLASNDESALGAMQALREVGLLVPHDVAVIGFDDRPESAVQEPALSSVAVPLFEMSYRAVEQLLRQIKVAMHLAQRASCGCGHRVRMGDNESQVDGWRRGLIPEAVPSPATNNTAEPEEIKALRQQLTEAFIASVESENPASLGDALDAILRQAAQGWDDAAIWQAAFSIMSDELPGLLERWPKAGRRAMADNLLEEARAMSPPAHGGDIGTVSPMLAMTSFMLLLRSARSRRAPRLRQAFLGRR
jgi:DNA-binding LacI/PurR family transcriptional regulator